MRVSSNSGVSVGYVCVSEGEDDGIKNAPVKVDKAKQERQQLMAEVDERKRKILRDVEVIQTLL